MAKMTSPPLENPSSCKGNGISIQLVVTSSLQLLTSQGVRLTKLNASVECGINFAKTFDVADEPITEGITFRINAESDNADKSELRRLLKMAEERCPVMYSMTHAIKVDATVN